MYQELWDADIDPANFRRSLTAAPPDQATAAPASGTYVEPTGERANASPRERRPPELFRAGTAWLAQPPVRRPRKPNRRTDKD
ncbi:MAG TPA: hypothetical protein VIU87_20360 [Mycobacterium sp.]